MSRPQSWRMVITLVVVWVGLWIALDGVVVDDAGLVFAYARHLAAGLGPVAQPGAAPIEAYSSPSWLGILAGITRMGLSPAAWARPLGLVLGGLTLAATRDLVRAQGLSHLQANTTALVLAGSVSFAYACSNGLETALLCAGLVSLLWSGQRAPWALGPLAAGVALTRPEGLLLAAVGLLAGKTLNHRLSWQSIGIAWGFAAGAFASYLAWRWALFGDWLPHTARVKLQLPIGVRLIRGFRYVASSLLTSGCWLLVVGRLIAPRAAPQNPADAIMAGIVATVAVYTGGDWMIQSRFMAPAWPFIALWTVPSIVGAMRTHPRWTRALLALYGATQGIQWISAASHPSLPLESVVAQTHLFAAIGPARCAEPSLSLATPDMGGPLWAHPEGRYLDLAGLTHRHSILPQNSTGAWLHRLRDTSPQLVLIQGPWQRITGLTAHTMAQAGYALLCERSEVVVPTGHTTPKLYVRADCTHRTPEPAERALIRWCSSSHRHPTLSYDR